ncbi:MAG: DNA mismatch repair protein MutS [Bacteroidota bacterium]
MFNKGDKVTFIDDSINGEVLSVSGSEIVIETEDGFEMKCTSEEIIKRGGFDDAMSSYIDNRTFDRIMKENSMDKRRASVKRPSRKDDYLIEVDLHIERILKNYKHMDSSDILEYQLNRAKYKLEESMRSAKKGLVFIHGHGDGVLKAELYSLLKRYNVQYYDGDYAKYAGGATEVVFK